MKIKIFSDHKQGGLIWAVRVVQQGEPILIDRRPHDDPRPIVEFYDCRYEHTDLGQFVSSYFIETILQRQAGEGLSLHGGIPEWRISGKTMDRVVEWMKQCEADRKEVAQLYEELNVPDLYTEDPDFPRSDWKYEVRNDYTNLGYWAWVRHRKEAL